MSDTHEALTVVEVQGLPPAVVVADAMVKSAAIILIALEVNTLGALTIKASGDTAAAAAAHDAGKAIARQLDALVGATVIPRYSSPAYPMWIACKPSVSGLLKSRNHLIPAAGLLPADDRAMGMLETRGFAGAVAALDAMLKSADVELLAKEKIGQTRVSVLVRGDVSAVTASLAAGAVQAERVGTLASAHVIPHPDPVIQALFPRPQGQ
ncbi:MAG TPA: BMC domain-containing protein [Candidatus Latescibacteria bacterium]|nr:BMC domain-containing protein [Candidatus Latescibacterota bacterium]